MSKTYFISNWKSNKTPQEAASWIDQVKDHLPRSTANLEVVICPPMIHLHLLKTHLPTIKLGVQDLSPYPDGAYTGATSARLLHTLVDFVILGHSERREHFSETSQRVALKVTQALEYKITPIIAVSKKTWRQQLNLIDTSQKSKVVLMYEPPEAISRQVGPVGTGEAAPIEQVVEVISVIKKSAPQTPVIYGGSIKSHNIAEFLDQKLIEGVLPGSASLNSQEWLKMLKISIKSRG